MKCSAVRTFLSQINDRQEPIAPIPTADFDFLSVNGYILRTTKEDYDKGAVDVARLSQLTTQIDTEKAEEEQTDVALQQDERKEHSFLFHFEGEEKKDEVRERIQNEMPAVSGEQSQLSAMEANLNELIRKKSMIDRMVLYDGEYLSLTGLGSVVSASYGYSYQYSNNQGSSTSNLASGSYTWSSNNFTYVNETDNQIGYSKPIYVWFAMNPSIPVGGKFYALNTQLTVVSKNYSLQLPTENKYVQTIQAEGTGQYQRNDSYGVFTASYTWDVYFDPSTGYIVGYNYVEQDNGQYQGKAGNFTYTDNLYVTSTSYNLALASAPPNVNSSTTTTNAAGLFGLAPYLGDIIALLAVVLFVALIAVYAATRRRRKDDSLPKHPYPPYTPPPSPPPSSTPWESKIDLGAQPSEQVVIRDVAKVNCKFCGTLIPSTADTCPYCGAPRQ